MDNWRPQDYASIGMQQGVDPQVLQNAVQTGLKIIQKNGGCTPVFSLRHLAFLADVDYGFLRAVVARKIQDPYTSFRIRKGPASVDGFRIICVPDTSLMTVQRWIN